MKGRIVVCKVNALFERRSDKIATVKDVGGIGMILIDTIRIDVGFQFVIPATVIDSLVAIKLQAYMESTK